MMSESTSLAFRVYEIIKAVRSGEVDPLTFRLTDSYQELKELVARIDCRLDIDEMLNEILGVKVDRVQELARVLASPEIYVAHLKEKTIKDLARLMKRKQPVVIGHLEQNSLNNSLERVIQLIDAMSREPPAEEIPRMTGIPNGYAITTEDAVFIEDIERFLAAIPLDGKVIFDDIIDRDDFETFLKHFLYVIILVSQGRLLYNPITRQLWKPQVPEAT